MTLARFPDVPPSRGHYESYYLRAVDPASPRALWLRHTVHKAPDGPVTGAIWLTVFDATEGRPPVAAKWRIPSPRPAPDGHGIVLGESTFLPGGIRGGAPGGEAEWIILVVPSAAPLRHLPRDWMYRAPLPRTKSGSPAPFAAIAGRVRLGDRTLELEGWRGMTGHNWGSEHAERWIWLHGIAFEGEPGAWLDLVCGRIRVAGRTLPWVANGMVRLDGRSHRLGGIGRARATRVEERPLGARLVLPGDGIRAQVEVEGPPGQAVVWRYADPGGPEHHVAHSSVARLELRIEPGGRTLRSAHGAAYELGMRETDHGLPVEPAPDP